MKLIYIGLFIGVETENYRNVYLQNYFTDE